MELREKILTPGRFCEISQSSRKQEIAPSKALSEVITLSKSSLFVNHQAKIEACKSKGLLIRI
jgi:hypothetical protein